MDKISVVVADDHPIFRLGLMNVITQNAGIELLGEAEDGEAVLELIRKKKPQVAVLDVEMPKLTGLQVCEIVQKEKLPTKVLILTMFKERGLYEKALEVGAMGYMLKDHAITELVKAIVTIQAGLIYTSEGLKESLKDEKSHLINDPIIAKQISVLSSTEKNILLLIARQKTSREIAQELFVSEKTIENHRYNIIKKLNLDPGKNSLLKFAINNNEYLK